jgi:hypothetical protein
VGARPQRHERLVSRAGRDGSGVVFKLNERGQETVLYNFAGGADGVYSEASVVMDGTAISMALPALAGTVNSDQYIVRPEV